MRCGGCGAKLGASPLLRALARLPDQNFSQVALGIGDDAALIRSGGDLLLTVDGFRALVSDPYLFGRITAHHSLNDILAMGGRGVSALALATVPLMSEAMMEEDLYLMLQGAVSVLNEQGIPLVGGHSAEGAELSLALTISGELDGRAPLSKAGLIPGQALILSKGLGTGVLLAAAMRGELSGDVLASVMTAMDTSNVSCAEILLDCEASAVTDVSGFGLAGHLSEMTRASGTGAELQLDRIPALPQAIDLLDSGVASSLHANNAQALNDFEYVGTQSGRVQLLADPQTAGGMLASVPEQRLQECLARLQEAGYTQAAAIGRVTEQGLRLSDRG
jgi:selenide,water dikinase